MNRGGSWRGGYGGRSASGDREATEGRSERRSEGRSRQSQDWQEGGEARPAPSSDRFSRGRSEARDGRTDSRGPARPEGRSDSRGPARPENRGAPTMRFPSDHVGRSDDRSLGALPRFPSDSVKGKHEHVYTAPMESSRSLPGRGGLRDGSLEGARSAFQGGPRPDSRPARPYGSRGDGHRYSRHSRSMADELPRQPRAVIDPTFNEVTIAEGDVTQVDPFELFCSYHLGLARDGQVRAPNLLDAARRFNAPPGLIKAALHHYHMDPEGLASVAFDMELARMDIQVSPPGVSKRELARGLYQEFIDALGERCVWETRPGPAVPDTRFDDELEDG